jgi:2-aminoadipate transaminase
MHNNPVTALQYGISEGYAPLREWVKADLTKKGVFAQGDDDVIITSGAMQVMEVMTKLVCNEGETIICEAPSFIGSLNTFRSYNAKLVARLRTTGCALKPLSGLWVKTRMSDLFM